MTQLLHKCLDAAIECHAAFAFRKEDGYVAFTFDRDAQDEILVKHFGASPNHDGWKMILTQVNDVICNCGIFPSIFMFADSFATLYEGLGKTEGDMVH